MFISFPVESSTYSFKCSYIYIITIFFNYESMKFRIYLKEWSRNNKRFINLLPRTDLLKYKIIFYRHESILSLIQ